MFEIRQTFLRYSEISKRFKLHWDVILNKQKEIFTFGLNGPNDIGLPSTIIDNPLLTPTLDEMIQINSMFENLLIAFKTE
jgi:hypothetical protein